MTAEWYETAFDKLYPILYAHRNEAEATAALETYAGFLQEGQPVLDLASGSGRYLNILVARGYAAVGVDLSHFLLRTSLEVFDLDGRVAQGDMRHIPFVTGSFGSVINMFTSFGYFPGDSDNLLVLQEVHRVLKEGGVFLLDFINAEKISRDLLDHTHREANGYDIDERRAIENQGKYLVKRAVVTNMETGDQEEIVERLRLYTRRDLLTMLGSVRMEVSEIFGDYAANPFVDGVSDRVILVARKK